VASQSLDAVVESICDVDATVWSYCDATRRVELTVASTFCAPLVNESAVPSEHLDEVAASVCDVDDTFV